MVIVIVLYAIKWLWQLNKLKYLAHCKQFICVDSIYTYYTFPWKKRDHKIRHCFLSRGASLPCCFDFFQQVKEEVTKLHGDLWFFAPLYVLETKEEDQDFRLLYTQHCQPAGISYLPQFSIQRQDLTRIQLQIKMKIVFLKRHSPWLP